MIRRQWIPAITLGLAAVRVLAAMLIPALRAPGAGDFVVAAVATCAAVYLVAVEPARWDRLAAAAAAAAFWLAPCLSAFIHGQDIPVASFAMAALAVVLIVAPPDSSIAFRMAILIGLVVIVLSLLLGVVSATGLTDAAFHRVGDYQRAVFGIPALQGVTLHPNTLGGIAAVTLVAATAVALEMRRLGPWLIPALATVALLWSQSRSGLVGAVVALITLLATRRWEHTRVWFVAGGLALSVLPMLLAWVLGSWISLEGILTGRPLAWGPAWQLFAESPLTGYGPDALSRDFWQTQAPQWWEPLHAHNELLENAAQAGLLGVAALVAVAAAAVLPALRRAGANGRLAAALVVFVAVVSGFEVPLGLTYFPISYLLPAMVVAWFAYTGPLGGRVVDRSRSPAARVNG